MSVTKELIEKESGGTVLAIISEIQFPDGVHWYYPVGTVAKDRVCITLIATAAKRIRQPSATEG